jgi:uroporphyrinogen-III synthase
MEQPLTIRILSTRALGNAARDLIHQQGWLVDIVSMIETHGVIKVEQIAAFLKLCNAPGNNLLLLFSSENAVKWLKWGLDKFGFKMPVGLKAVSVGGKALSFPCWNFIYLFLWKQAVKYIACGFIGCGL